MSRVLVCETIKDKGEGKVAEEAAQEQTPVWKAWAEWGMSRRRKR